MNYLYGLLEDDDRAKKLAREMGHTYSGPANTGSPLLADSIEYAKNLRGNVETGLRNQLARALTMGANDSPQLAGLLGIQPSMRDASQAGYEFFSANPVNPEALMSMGMPLAGITKILERNGESLTGKAGIRGGGGGKAVSDLGRSRPVDTMVFSKPVKGKSGVEIHSYTWQWKPEEYLDKLGEDRVRRVSNWSAAEQSADTGRDIVHQFVVRMPDGTERTVSLESAAKLLGYTDDQASFKSFANSAKNIAKMRLKISALQTKIEAYNAAKSDVDNLPVPKISQRDAQGWFKMDDEMVRQFEPGPITPERAKLLTDNWKSKRIKEIMGDIRFDELKTKRDLSDLIDKASKLENKLGVSR